MKTLKEFISIAQFLGEEMTEQHAGRLMDQAKKELSMADLERLARHVTGPFYTAISEYHSECASIPGYSR